MSKKKQDDQKREVGVTPTEKLWANQGNVLLSYQANATRLSQEAKTIHTSSPPVFLKFLADAMRLMEEDIYLSPLSEKESVMAKLPKNISQFLEANSSNVIAAAQIITQLSKNNVELKYDKAWLYEERQSLFKETILKLAQVFSEGLEKSKDRDIKTIGTEPIGQVMQALSHWDFYRDAAVLEILIRHMEIRFTAKQQLSPAITFCFLDGLACFQSLVKNNPERAAKIAQWAEMALPLLLTDDPPLAMFPAKSLTLSRIGCLKFLLPKPDPAVYGRLVTQWLMRPSNLGKTFTQEMIDAALPDHIIPNKKLNAALNAKESALYDDPSISDWHGVTVVKGEKQPYSAIKTYAKYMRHLNQGQNPKGLQWSVVRYSECIISQLQRGRTLYPLADIRDYLKLLRRCLLNVDSKPIESAIQKLSQEALRDGHFSKMDATTAIDLLWINLVLSTTGSQSMAYSIADQARLFKKTLDAKINASEAHALYEIKALQWHGKVPFSSALIQKMRGHWEKFSASVNPSAQEKELYSALRDALPPDLKTCLHANFICDKTGYEIDIVYRRKSKKQKIAIHVDGPAHFNMVTGLPTLKTRFRNRCLEAAGWVSLEINITKPYHPAAIAAELIKLVVTPSPVVEMKSSVPVKSEKKRSNSLPLPPTSAPPRPRAASWPALFAVKHQTPSDSQKRGSSRLAPT